MLRNSPRTSANCSSKDLTLLRSTATCRHACHTTQQRAQSGFKTCGNSNTKATETDKTTRHRQDTPRQGHCATCPTRNHPKALGATPPCSVPQVGAEPGNVVEGVVSRPRWTMARFGFDQGCGPWCRTQAETSWRTGAKGQGGGRKVTGDRSIGAGEQGRHGRA